VQNAVPTGDDGSRASRTLMVPTTAQHNNAPCAGPPFVTYLKLPPCAAAYAGWRRLPAGPAPCGVERGVSDACDELIVHGRRPIASEIFLIFKSLIRCR
jgi:hypothetical protein